MADQYYRVAFGGQRAVNVTKSGAATPTAFVDVRVTIDTPAGEKAADVKLAFLNALNAVKERVLQDNWP